MANITIIAEALADYIQELVNDGIAEALNEDNIAKHAIFSEDDIKDIISDTLDDLYLLDYITDSDFRDKITTVMNDRDVIDYYGEAIEKVIDRYTDDMHRDMVVMVNDALDTRIVNAKTMAKSLMEIENAIDKLICDLNELG